MYMFCQPVVTTSDKICIKGLILLGCKQNHLKGSLWISHNIQYTQKVIGITCVVL